MVKFKNYVVILDADKNLYHLLSNAPSSELEFVYFNNIEKAQTFLKNNHVICFLTEIIIDNEHTGIIAKNIKHNKSSINYNTPIIIHSTQINKQFILKVKDKVIGGFVKPIVSKDSFKEFVPLITKIYKKKSRLFKEILSLENSLSSVLKSLKPILNGDHSKNEKADVDYLNKFMTDLLIKEKLFNNNISPHLNEAFHDNFDLKELKNILLNMSLSSELEPNRLLTCQNLEIYKSSQENIDVINDSLSTAYLEDPEITRLEMIKMPQAEKETMRDSIEEFAKKASGEEKDYQLEIFSAIKENKTKKIEGFIFKNIDFNVLNSLGQSPLHIIAKSNNLEILQLLMKSNISIDTQDRQGLTALAQAVISKNVILLAPFISMNPIIDLADKKGMTPLMYACQNGLINAVVDLTMAGADPTKVNEKGQSCADIAKLKENFKIIKFLESLNKDKAS